MTTTKINANDSIVQNYIELDKRYTKEIKPFFEALKTAKDALEIAFGVGATFQDDEGTVYEVVVPEWKSVQMEHIAVNRTKRNGEDKGTLSMKRAVELGYELPGKSA